MPEPLLVVDAPFLLYRSFFAMPESITGAQGHPVGGLLGSVNLLLRAAADFRPRAIVACFGADAAAYRVELYPPYHAQRPPVPDPLAWQFEQAPRLFEAFGWQSQSTDTLEADDLLGALAHAERKAGGTTLILTGDRDMFQCVDDHTSVLLLKPGKAGFERMDPDAVLARYGIPPALVPDFIALRGDPSDGLPGAPGIGEKTAADLLRRHGTLENAIAAASGDSERPRVAAALRDHADELRAFRAIATLHHVELERPPDASTDLAVGAAAAAKLGLGQLSRRLAAAGSLSEI